MEVPLLDRPARVLARLRNPAPLALQMPVEERRARHQARIDVPTGRKRERRGENGMTAPSAQAPAPLAVPRQMPVSHEFLASP